MQLPAWAPVLTDGTVTLRAHRPDDVDAIVEQCRDPQMQRWTTVPAPYGRADAEQFVAERPQRWADGEELSFAVQLADRYCGGIDLRPRSSGCAEVGYALGPWARGRGVASAALRLVLGWGFAELGLQSVLWRAQVGNWASRRVAWAAGFQMHGAVPGLLEHRDAGALDGWIGWLSRGDRLAAARPWFEPPVLRGRAGTAGAQLLLRPHHEADGDVQRIVEACTDPETTRWLTRLPQPYGADDARRHLSELRADQAGGDAICWAVADPAHDRFLAEVVLFRLGSGTGSGEIGYLVHPDARGRGVATSAVRLAARHALLPAEDGGLGLVRLQLLVDDGNAASERVARKAGFRHVGVDRSAGVISDGPPADLLRFDLLATELDAGFDVGSDGHHPAGHAG